MKSPPFAPEASAPALQLQGFGAGYGESPVVQGISFTLEKGELVALLGPNASGKTTLLKGICGLLPTMGTCLVQGREPARLPPKQRAGAIAYLGQRGGAAYALPVLDAVLMGFNPVLPTLGQPLRRHRQAAMEALERVGLCHRASDDIQTLSEGQRQLVLLARALVQDTPLLLLDEPDSALDFSNRHMVYRALQSLLAGGEKAALLSMHDPNFALRYCSRLLLLHEGRLLADLRLETTQKETLEAQLGAIYGPVVLLRHKTHYVMTQKEEE